MRRQLPLLAATAVLAAAVLVTRARRSARAIDFGGRVVVIIGGSRGLGLVMARELAAEGARVVLVARDADALGRARDDAAAAGGEVHAMTCDVRDREAVGRLIADIVVEFGVIDVLVNCAGTIQVGPVQHMSLADFEDAMATHFWGPLYAMLAVLPHMRRSGARRIVNISSIGGKIGVPHLVPYDASKFALTGLSEALGAELAREGIAVTTVCPGLMRTGSTYNAWFKGRHQREFAWFHVSDALPGLSIDARRAARQILEACRHGDAELIITPPARLAVLLQGVAPSLMNSLMALGNRVLPKPTSEAGDERRSGWQSVSRAAPSPVTTLADRATAANNEVPL